MFSQKTKYFLYGILTYFSLVTLIAQAGSDGIFGDYFAKMTTACPFGDSVLTGFDIDPANYGARQCKTVSELLGDIFGTSIIPPDSSVIGINADGTLKYKNNIWKENGTDISYTGGKVGIGTDIPASKLDVVGGSIKVSNGGNDIIIGGNNAGVKVNISSIGVSYFNGGFVGIGTNNPTRQLDIIGSAKISNQLDVQSITLAGKNLTIPGNCFALGDVIQYNNGWICGKIPVHGICGGANGSATTAYPTTGLCSVGNKVDIDTTGTDGSYNWRCDGVNGGNSPSCSARPNEIHCTMRLDNDCGYSGTPTFDIYTTCGNFTVGRTDGGAANIFPIPGNSTCTINGDSAVGIGGPINIPIGSQGNIWYNSCDDTSYLYCGIY